MNLNVIMLIVSGTLQTFFQKKNSLRLYPRKLSPRKAYNMPHIKELTIRTNGYDAGFIRDEYGCNLEKCECAHFNQFVIGKHLFLKFFDQKIN